MTTFTLAHLSDLHVLELQGVTWTRYLNKRLTGAVNLWIGRGQAHPVSMCEALVADVRSVAPDHVAITGDLSNLAFLLQDMSRHLEAEPLMRRALLIFEESYGEKHPEVGYDRVSVIPGNHDIYTKGSLRDRRFEAHFGHLMWAPDDTERTYPWIKPVGDALTLVGFRSAHPVPPLFAHGWVDDAQLSAVRAARASWKDRFAVAMVHHNLHERSPKKTWMHGLRNRAQVLDTCSDSDVGMLLHGHTHVAHRFRHMGMPVVGCGSSTWRSDDPAHVARYNLYHIDNGTLRDVQVRVYNATTERFEPGGSLTVP